MSRYLTPGIVALSLMLLAVLSVPAQQVVPLATAPAQPAGQGAPGETQTLVYLGETGPTLVRLHLIVDGKPFSAAGEPFLKKLFEYADVNNDGTLSKEEAARLPTPSILLTHYSGALGIFQNPNTVAPFAELDANKDGKVTLDELKAYYRKSGFGSFQLRGSGGTGKSGTLTEALFKHLDRNGDGKLSREELAAAEEALHHLDLDEDEMISEDELVPGENPYSQFFGFAGDSMGPASPAFQMFSPADPPGKLTKTILDRYDKDRNGKLSPKEIGLDGAEFARIDTNKDGQIDAAELEKWLAGPSDLELTVRLGQLPPKPRPGGLLNALVGNNGMATDSAVEVSPGKTWPLAAATRIQTGGVVLTRGIAEIDIRGDNQRFFANNNNFYQQRFRMALKDNKDYLTKAEVNNNDNNTRFFRGLFEMADRDGDGKLYEKELSHFLDVIGGGGSSFATLTIADHGPGLFELIDSNRDNRLSIRELRTAWDRIAPWDKEKVGAITRAQVPRQYQLTLRQGPPDNNGRFRRAIVARNQGGMYPTAPGRGPLWFRKMDRNGDGDVSRREWLGSLEDFKKIDTDGDGLISAEEAQKADVWFRDRLKQQK
jgi:Ca2+-binding EF-hand superfamily protein